MENLLLILLLIFIGMGLRRMPAFPRDSAAAFNQFVIYVPLPALILLQVPKLTFSPDLLIPVVTPWALIAVSAAAVLGLSRLFGWERSVTGGLLLTVCLGNTSFLGFPMIEALFGADFISHALLYDQLGTFFGLAFFGAFILGLYGDGLHPTPGALIRRILVFPPFVALLTGLALKGIILPELLVGALEKMAATLVPVVMVAVGFQLRFRVARPLLGPLAAGLGIKMVMAPLLTLLAMRLLGLSGDLVVITIFEAAMPPMITAGALAMAAGLAPELMAAMVGLGVFLSFALLPLWRAVLAGGVLG